MPPRRRGLHRGDQVRYGAHVGCASARGSQAVRGGLFWPKRSTSTRRPLRSVRRPARGFADECSLGLSLVAATPWNLRRSFFAGRSARGRARNGWSTCGSSLSCFVGLSAAVWRGGVARLVVARSRAWLLRSSRAAAAVQRSGAEKSAPESADQALAELLAQDARAHLLDRALGEFAELKRAERDADEPRRP